MDSNCVDEGQSAPVKAREGAERDETESTEADKDDVHDLNQAGVGCQTAESTVQGLPEIDSGVCGRPSRQRKPPSRFGTWVTD